MSGAEQSKPINFDDTLEQVKAIKKGGGKDAEIIKLDRPHQLKPTQLALAMHIQIEKLNKQIAQDKNTILKLQLTLGGTFLVLMSAIAISIQF